MSAAVITGFQSLLPSMEFLLASGIGAVTTCGLWLLLRGRSFSVVLGLAVLGYAVNVFIFVMGRLWRNAPSILGQGPLLADPLPQALVLTAIVIGFATTGLLIELALRSSHDNGSDHVDGREPGLAAAAATAAAATAVAAHSAPDSAAARPESAP